jgi:hypothetical protein
LLTKQHALFPKTQVNNPWLFPWQPHFNYTTHRRRGRCTPLHLLPTPSYNCSNNNTPRGRAAPRSSSSSDPEYLDPRFPSKRSKWADYHCNGNTFKQPADHPRRRRRSSRPRPGPEPRASSLCGSCPTAAATVCGTLHAAIWYPDLLQPLLHILFLY